MPDQSSAAEEHALIQEITQPLGALPDDATPTAADTEFPTVLRGYDKFAVDAYVHKTSQLLAELQARSSPQAAVRRALERVGEDVSGILQRAHDTAEGITSQSRSEAEDRLEVARREASQLTSWARARVKELDVDTDRIWVERDRIVDDARELARQLLELAEAAAARFPAAEEPGRGDLAVEEPASGETSETAALGAAPLAEPDDDEPLEPEPEPESTATRAFEPVQTEAFDTLKGSPFDAEADEDNELPGDQPGELRFTDE